MKRILLAVVIPVLLCVVWECAAAFQWLNPALFPAPTRLAATLLRLVEQGELTAPLQSTLIRTLRGLAGGTLAGAACGLVMGTGALRMLVEPLLSALSAAPKVALLPLIMLVVGIGHAPGDILVALAVFIPVSLQALDAIRSVDRGLVELAVNYGANRWDLLRRVYLPASLPRLFSGLRLGVGQALVIAISVEMIQPQGGLGGMIWMAWQTFDVDRLYLGIFLACLAGAGFYGLLSELEKRLVPWRNNVH